MTLGQMAPRMSPARSAGSSLIWQNPKSTLRHLHHLHHLHQRHQRHQRLPIASTLQNGLQVFFQIFICFRALVVVLIALAAI
jgi:hypothetical protein